MPQYAIENLQPCTFRLESPARGGCGSPPRRDPEAVLREVLNELLSIDEAREVYGVVIVPGRVDLAATAATRQRMAVGS